MPVTVRPLAPDEAPLFRALRLEALSTSSEFFGTAYEDEVAQPLAWFEAELAALTVFAAFGDKGEPIGMASLRRERGVRKRHKAILGGMFVAPAARGSGAAPALVQAVLDHARAAGVEQVLLTVMARNARARALYARMGFVDWGLEPRGIVIGGEGFDDVHMICRL